MTSLLTPAVLFVVGLTAVLGVCRDQVDCDKERCHEHLDVAIIGAGPGGAYSAYKLRNEGKTIGLYEYSDRVGGRTFSYRLPNAPDVHLQLGAMRYIRGVHTRLERVIQELGLHPQEFTEGFGRPRRTRFYLRGTSMTYQQAMHGDVPYDLTVGEKLNQHRILQYYLDTITGNKSSGVSVSSDNFYKLRSTDGRLLSDITFDEALDIVASEEGKQFTKDTVVFDFGTDDTSFLMAYQMTYDFSMSKVFTVAEGLQSVTEGLVRAFLESSDGHSLHKNHQLKAIRSKSDGTLILYHQPTRTIGSRTQTQAHKPSRRICARQAILAVPVFALRQVDWSPLREHHAFSAVVSQPASKLFMTFDTAWWMAPVTNRSAHVTMTDRVFSQMFDWGMSQDSGDHVLLASYADGNETLLLKSLQDQGEAIQGSAHGNHRVTGPLKEAILSSLAQAYGIDRHDIPEPKSAVCQFWVNFPYGGGWVLSQAGYDARDTLIAMRRPSLTEEVFVVGSDYSDGTKSGWVEGAFEKAQDVVNRYFLEVDS